MPVLKSLCHLDTVHWGWCLIPGFATLMLWPSLLSWSLGTPQEGTGANPRGAGLTGTPPAWLLLSLHAPSPPTTPLPHHLGISFLPRAWRLRHQCGLFSGPSAGAHGRQIRLLGREQKIVFARMVWWRILCFWKQQEGLQKFPSERVHS